MAATTARALAPLMVFFLVVNTAPAARTVPDTVVQVCSKTHFPAVCALKLSLLPDCKNGSPRRLAELFVNLTAAAGSEMAAFVHEKLGGSKDDAVLKCSDACSDEVEEAVAHLNGLVREPTDAKFLELKSWLSSTLGGASACQDSCGEIMPPPMDVNSVKASSEDLDQMLRVTLDLITEASGSMSADIALAPSDASAPAAYGFAAAAAPVSGSSSSSPAEAPAVPEGGVAPAASPASASVAAAVPGPAAAYKYGTGASAEAPSSEGPAASDEAADAPSSEDVWGADAPAAGDSSDADATA